MLTSRHNAVLGLGFGLAVLLTGCSSSTPAGSSAPDVTTASSAPDAPTSEPATPAATCGLTPGGADLISWLRVPTIADSAQILGSVDLVHCLPTAETYADSSPTGPGYCSVLATASANPGYNADATPALRPRRGVLVAVGPAC